MKRGHHYREYIVRKNGKEIARGNSTKCAAALGVAQSTFYRYATGFDRAPYNVEIEISGRSGKWNAGEDSPCSACPREERCYLKGCEAYRAWFGLKWRSLQEGYKIMRRRAMRDRRKGE